LVRRIIIIIIISFVIITFIIIINRFAHSAGPGMVRHSVEWIGSGVDDLMQTSKWQVRSAFREARSAAQSFARSLTHSLAAEKREELQKQARF